MGVIGAGAAGLVAAREMLREGHRVAVYEQTQSIGGTWVFEEEVDEDLLARRGHGKKVHSSMYRHLRTNLPRELMGFTDYPLTPLVMGARSHDSRRFCGHEEVRRYLEAFADHYQLWPCLHLGQEVKELRGLPGPSPRWRFMLQGTTGASDGEGTYQDHDAVLVCNGHYSEPNLPDMRGQDVFPGRVMHSHNYRDNSQFKNKRVVVVGASNSGDDLARELAEVASCVYISAKSWRGQADDWWQDDAHPYHVPFGPRSNIHRVPLVQELREDSSVVLTGGRELSQVDVVLYATGYIFDFPFLGPFTPSPVNPQGAHVAPLYLHMFPLGEGASTMAFIGLNVKIAPFPVFEVQCKVAARVFAGRAQLPSQSVMSASVDEFQQQMKDLRVPPRHYHTLGDRQWEYCNTLLRLGYNAEEVESFWSDQAPCPLEDDIIRLPSWLPRMYEATGALKLQFPDTYRDTWVDEVLALEAGEYLDIVGRQVLASRQKNMQVASS